mmetsp:Transcript_22834/g.77779  ORF Transcript_22834/g.77779 Transcript_22834/m.77779 type:complete len:204 (-) Transcript_22834:732-1343(-)
MDPGSAGAGSGSVEGVSPCVLPLPKRRLDFEGERELSEKRTSFAKETVFFLLGSVRLKSDDQGCRRPLALGELGYKPSESGGNHLPCFSMQPDKNSVGFSGFARTTSRMTFPKFSSILCFCMYCLASCKRIWIFVCLSTTSSPESPVYRCRDMRSGIGGTFGWTLLMLMSVNPLPSNIGAALPSLRYTSSWHTACRWTDSGKR